MIVVGAIAEQVASRCWPATVDRSLNHSFNEFTVCLLKWWLKRNVTKCSDRMRQNVNLQRLRSESL